MKIAKAAAYPEEVIPNSCMRVTIKGLRQVGDDQFELDGVQPRQVDWAAVASALGERELHPALEDALASAVWKHDLVMLLSDRIQA